MTNTDRPPPKRRASDYDDIGVAIYINSVVDSKTYELRERIDRLEYDIAEAERMIRKLNRKLKR